MKELNKTLLEQLKEYTKTPAYPFHMPGHKRLFDSSILPYDIDITEIDGFDDLHEPTGIILEIEKKLAKAFHSDHAYMLINGSTAGILAAISAVTDIGDDIIIARNCHKSVYNAAYIRNLNAEYIYPETTDSGICCSISPQAVKEAIQKKPTAKAVVLTSPTYEGVVSDIGSIAEICHESGLPLIADSAHGAHMMFCSFGAKGEPIQSGADIVIESLHKTLPSLTQTAAVFLNSKLVEPEKLKNYLEIYQTSSPSYLLMSSVEVCADYILSRENKFEEYEKRLMEFMDKMTALKHLKLLRLSDNFFSYDMSKIVILTDSANITGVELMKRLREEYLLELEMAYPTYALAMTSVCDSQEGFDRLAHALIEIDSSGYAPGGYAPTGNNQLCGQSSINAYPQEIPNNSTLHTPHSTLTTLHTPHSTLHTPHSELHTPHSTLTTLHTPNSTLKPTPNCAQRSIYAYPPGIPIVAAGEVLGEKELRYIEFLKNAGVTIKGL